MELQRLTFMQSWYHDLVSLPWYLVKTHWKIPGLVRDSCRLPGWFVSQFKKAMSSNQSHCPHLRSKTLHRAPLEVPERCDITGHQDFCCHMHISSLTWFVYYIYTTSSCHSGIVQRLWHLSNLSFIEMSLPESNSMSQTEQTVCLIHKRPMDPYLDRSGDLLEVFSAEVKPATAEMAAGWFTPRTHQIGWTTNPSEKYVRQNGFIGTPIFGVFK